MSDSNTGEKYRFPNGVGIRVVVDGEFYTVDEFIDGDPVLRSLGEHSGVKGGDDDPTVELHLVDSDAENVALYTPDTNQ